MSTNLINTILYNPLNIISNQISGILPSFSLINEGGRVLNVALPFIALYRPAGSALSYGATAWNICQRGLHLYHFDPRTPQQSLSELKEVVKTVAECADIVFKSPYGFLIYAVIDLIDKLRDFAYNSDEPALKKALPIISQGLYMFAFFYGNSLHVLLLSLAFHASSNFYQMTLLGREMFSSGQGWRHEKNLECLGKMFMGAIQVCQAGHCISQIRAENSFDHPLKGLAKKIDAHRVILTDAKGKKYDFGAHFHGYGKGLVKGMNISFNNIVLPDGRSGIELFFKLNHVHRDRLGKVLEQFSSLTPHERKDFLKSLDIQASDFKLEASTFKFGDCHKITFEGLGALMVGQTNGYYQKDRLIVQVREGNDIDTFLQILTPLGLSDALQQSSAEDIVRMKMGLLFRTFFPRDAFTLERNERFFDSSLDQLRCEIITEQPDMQRIFQEYLPRMEQREILPGYFRYAIPGLGQDAQVRALTTSLLKLRELNEKQLDTLASIFKIGLISKEWRKNRLQGTYYAEDVIYTQVVVDEHIQRSHPLSELSAYSRPIRLFLSRRLLEVPTFQYLKDYSTGCRDDENYPQRLNIIDFVKTLRSKLSDPSINLFETCFHEVMIKDRIPPEEIIGMLIETPQQKELVVSHLRKLGIILTDSKGTETINGIPLDKFIHTNSKVITEAMVEPSTS